MREEAEVDIAIVGGGIVGLALARALLGRGLKLALIDAQPPLPAPPAKALDEPAFDARVFALSIASVEWFRELGAWDAIQAAGACPYEDMRVWDADGTGAIHFSAADVHQPALGYIAENAAIVQALEHLLHDENLALLRPARVEGIEPDFGARGIHHRLLLCEGGSLRARLLVGADGSNSVIRRLGGFPVNEWDYGHRAIVTSVKTERSHAFTAWQRFMSQGPLAFLPLLNPATLSRDQQYYSSIVWSCLPEQGDRLMALDDEAFRRELEDAFEARLGAVQACGQRFVFPLRQMHARDYVVDGLALVGDAAHTIHPLAGQGVNLGLLDARCLAEVLLEARARGEDFAGERVLSRYQRARKGHNLGMMALMEGFKRLFENDALFLRWMRNAGLGAVDRLPVVKKQLMSRAMGL